jgi:predicted DCC family thiol-disulfide oxidoreductase YuxK
MFSSLQSDEAKRLLPDDITQALDSVVVLSPSGQIFRESDAILEIARHMGGVYPAFRVFSVLPGSIRDGLYKWVARNRYRWFGKKDVCRVPTRELASRFI